MTKQRMKDEGRRMKTETINSSRIFSKEKK